MINLSTQMALDLNARTFGTATLLTPNKCLFYILLVTKPGITTKYNIDWLFQQI